MPRLTVTLLGGVEIRLESGALIALPTRKARALLAYLALPAGRRHSRDELAGLLWGGRRDDSARNSLRQALFGVRRALAASAGAPLVLESDQVLLHEPDIDVDVAAFHADAAEGTPAALERAMARYRGDLLAGLTVSEPPFDEWLRIERDRTRELAVQCLGKLLAHHREGGATEPAIQTALRLLAIDPLQEPVRRTLMDLYAASGRRADALRQYQVCVELLHRELRVAPEPETQALHQRILRTPLRQGRDPAPLVAGAASHDSVLIGRDVEVRLLRQALTHAAAGFGRVVGVLGEAGIGKTRLVTELSADAAERGAAVLIGRAHESEQALPFGPWTDALRTGLAGKDDLLERLGPATRARLARIVLEVHPGVESPTVDADHRPVFEAVLACLRALAATRPVVVILEDLHWADQLTLRLTAFLAHRLHELSILLVATAREEQLWDALPLVGTLDELAREPHFHRLLVPPLARPGTEELVRALCPSGIGAALDDVVEQVWALSEGNPFVVVEAMRAVAERCGSGALTVPERVRDMVQRRLEQLNDAGQSLVAIAAVIGRDFDFRLLQHASGLGPDAAAERVDDLVRRRVLHGLGDRLDFVHGRIRETVLLQLLPHRRAMLHRAVAEAIEDLHAAALEPHDVALAGHYRRAGAWDRAMMYAGRAGLRALSDGAHAEASTLLRYTLDALDHLPDVPDATRLRADLLLAFARASYHLGDVEQMLRTLRDVEPIALELGDERRLRRCLEGIAFCLASFGELPAAIEAVERAASLGADNLTTRYAYQAARAYYGIGDYRRAVEAARFEMGLFRGDREHARRWGLPLAAAARFWLILSLAELGAFEEARREVEAALRFADSSRRPIDLLYACLPAGRVALVQGDLSAAIHTLERVRPLCQETGDFVVYLSRVAAPLGLAYVQSGDPDQGLSLLRQAVDADAALRFAYHEPMSLASLAEGSLLASDLGPAEENASRAADHARRHGQRGWEAWALRLRGEVARHRGAWSSAAAFYRDAMTLAATLGMRPLLARCHRGLAGLDGAERTHAGHHAAVAAAMYRELGLSDGLDRAAQHGPALTESSR
jgi:DNA-binding SARP family transcriptional activator